MAWKHKHSYSFLKVLEIILLIVYLLILVKFFSAKEFSFANWFLIIFTTIVFMSFIIGLKIYRSIAWIITHQLEDFIFTILYKFGLGKYAVKLINIVNDEKLHEDKDYKTFKQYMDRKKVFHRILNRNQWIGLTADIGKDSLYIGKHFIHKKKEQLTEQDAALDAKQLHNISGADFEHLLYRLFGAMGYTVNKTGTKNDQLCNLILLLGEQKLLLQARRSHDAPVGVTGIQEALKAQQQNMCHGTMIISLSDFTTEAIELAKTNSIGLVSKARLKELLKQYLNEVWN